MLGGGAWLAGVVRDGTGESKPKEAMEFGRCVGAVAASVEMTQSVEPLLADAQTVSSDQPRPTLFPWYVVDKRM